MNILIIGGLIGIALLALLGAILLSMAEERAEKEREAKNAAPPPQLPQPFRMPPQAQLPGVVVRPVDQVKVGELIPLNKEAPLSTLSTIADELRTLTQRTGDLEQRLSGLTALLERRRVSEVTASDNDVTL